MNEYLDMLRPAAQQASLLLTVPTIVFCVWVVWELYRLAWQAMLNENRSAIQWFIIGVAISFIGDALDNFYWGIAWSADYLEIPIRRPLFANGVFSNIPFRQTAGILAGYCHIRGIFCHANGLALHKEERRLNRVMKWSFIVGAGYVLILWLAKRYM
jgi:hypothetical protein